MNNNTDRMDSKQNRKLAVAAFLRSSASQNMERLVQIDHILNGGEISSSGNRNMITQAAEQLDCSISDEEKTYQRSFRNRCVASIILTIVLFLGMMSEDEKIIKYVERIKIEISQDYSENLFDFIKQIPYTLEYEKINA